MILLPSDLSDYREEVGSKTMNLKRLQDLGLNVPNFVALPSSLVKNLWDQGKKGVSDINNIVNEIKDKLPAEKYVVRSSALMEDTASSSLAGQFLTKINISSEQLFGAIFTVIEDAHVKLGGKLELFSIIVQEYIVADFSGVTFTRNPLGSREMVVEYQSGIGENVVGGKVVPQRYKLFWNDPAPVVGLINFKQAVEQFKKIEQAYNFPQDIEWCVRGGD
jgi:rifampicin phosphotransferase